MNCLDAELFADLETGADEARRAEALAHLDSCPPCRAFKAELGRALEKLGRLPVMYVEPEPKKETWSKIEARLREPVVAAAPEVSVGCSYCKGKLARSEAVYCAGCLAPHHQDCWTDHGKCAACNADEHVRAERVRVRRRRALPIAAALACGVGVGVAALAPWKRTAPPPSSAASTPPPSPVATEANTAPPTEKAVPARRFTLGDTVHFGYVSGRVVGIDTRGLRTIQQWADGKFLEGTVSANDDDLRMGDLLSETTVPCGSGRLRIEERRFKYGANGSRNVDLKLQDGTSALLHARVSAGSPRESQPVGPLFPGDPAHTHFGGDPFQGEVAVLFDAAKDVVDVTSPAARSLLVSDLASPWLNETLLERVVGLACANGDPELALALACRTPRGDDEAGVLRGKFGGMNARVAEALAEHVMTPQESYQVVEALATGVLVRHAPQGFVITVKERELALLSLMESALTEGRAWRLYRFAEKTPSLRAEVCSVFQHHLGDAVDAFARQPDLDSAAVDAAGAFLEDVHGAPRYLLDRVAHVDAAYAETIERDVQRNGFGALALTRLRQDLSSTPRKP